MPIPVEYQKAVQSLPPPLVALVKAEISAGNAIKTVERNGARIVLRKRIMTRQRASRTGIIYVYAENCFTDERGAFAIIEPEFDSEPEPRPPRVSLPSLQSATAKFVESMKFDDKKWHDGVGYDLSQIERANADERERIEAVLLGKGVSGWRDVEALAALDTPRARSALRKALKEGSNEVRVAVLGHAPNLVSDDSRTKALVQTLIDGEYYGGLTQALLEVETYHPPEVIEALLYGALRKRDAGVHFAAMLLFLHGKADSSFDWNQRPFFLRFKSEDSTERKLAFDELCAKIGVNPSKYY